jgi:hypothetical protein
MVVRAQWHNGRVNGLQWACRRAPGCEGTRRIRSPEAIQPIAYDASAQAIFDWESAHDRRPVYRRDMAQPASSNGGLRGFFGRVLSRQEEEAEPIGPGSAGYFDGLVEHGFVILEERSLPAAHAAVDNLVIGPSGLYVVERKPWPGQISTSADAIFVDGRQRMGATDQVVRAAAVLSETLDYELKPLGVGVQPALLFENAANKLFEGVVGKVLVGGSRGLPKHIRGTAEPVLGPETIVRLALAADRLLE